MERRHHLLRMSDIRQTQAMDDIMAKASIPPNRTTDAMDSYFAGLHARYEVAQQHRQEEEQ